MLLVVVMKGKYMRKTPTGVQYKGVAEPTDFVCISVCVGKCVLFAWFVFIHLRTHTHSCAHIHSQTVPLFCSFEAVCGKLYGQIGGARYERGGSSFSVRLKGKQENGMLDWAPSEELAKKNASCVS